MPNAPRRFNPGGKPPAQAKPWERTRRGTNKERGYSTDWNKLRNAYIQENPLCERCEEHDRVTPAREVNHKIPFNGPDDPLRLDWSNLESVCTSCHRKREAERRKGIKVQPTTHQRNLHIVCGPPGSGKTTFVEQRKESGDLVFDFDLIAHAMGCELYNHPPHFVAVIESMRELFLQQSQGTAWVIYTDLGKARATAMRFKSQLHILDTPAEVCIERLRNANRPRLEARIEAVRQWWAKGV